MLLGLLVLLRPKPRPILVPIPVKRPVSRKDRHPRP